MRRLVCVCLLLVCGGVVGAVAVERNAPPGETAVAADWTCWRGPNRDGISPDKGLLTEWTEAGPPLAYQSRGLGSGYSSVAIAGDRLFTMGRLSDGCHLICCDRSDGTVLWTAPVGGGDPNCTPTVDGDLVYGLGRDGDLVCVKTADGSEVWRKNFGRDFGGKMMSGWGYSESPLVDGERLICTPGGQQAILAALNKKTGAVVWQCAMAPNPGPAGNDGAAYSSPVVSNGGGVKQYVQLVGRGVIGVRATDGKLLWGYNRIANGTASIPTPIVRGNYVFTSSGYGDGGTALLELKKAAGNSVTVTEKYYFRGSEMQNHHGGMILAGNHVYFGNGHNNGFPLCVELLTGKVAWKPGRGAGSGSAAITLADGHLYFRYQDGTMALIEATPADYRLKGSFKLASRIRESWPHPVVVGGRMYLRDQDVLMVYDVRKNAE